jgi:hypothetical protein
VEVWKIWKHAVEVLRPIVRLDLGENRTEAAFTGMRNMAYLNRMSGASEGSKTESVGLTAVDSLPDIEDYVPGDHILNVGKEIIPNFL